MKLLLTARRNEGDGCQVVEEAVTGACTFHPFVHGTTHVGAVSPQKTDQLHDDATGGMTNSAIWSFQGSSQGASQ